MNTQRLVKTLQQELQRNKKKTAILGISLLVAIYFWAPLIKDWTAPESSSPKAKQPVVATPEQTPRATPDVAGAPVAKENHYTWEQLSRWMAQDPWMSSAVMPEQPRNPFQFVQKQRELTDQQALLQQQQESEQEHTPESLNMVLQSTIVGTRSKLATINGVTYAEKSTVLAETNQENRKIEFVVTEIHPQYVLLVRDGKQYPLKLNRKQLASGRHIVLRGRSQGSK